MSHDPLVQIVTANALIEGDVVYLSGDGGWTRHLVQARPFADRSEAEAALAHAARRADIVVGCYLATVRQTPKGLEPAHFREAFRARGPSNHVHGKQAAQAGAA